MVQKPEVSIVILTFGDGDLLLRTLAHFAVTPAAHADIEFIVVDVLSKLDRGQIQCIDQYSQSLAILRIESTQNHLSKNRNLACRSARGNWILFLDADAELEPASLRSLISCAKITESQDPNFAGMGGINVPPESEGSVYKLQASFQRFFWGHLWSSQMWIPPAVTRVPHLSTVFALVKRSVLQKVGGFHESFSQVCEDQDLGFRMVNAGHSLYLCPAARVVHRSESRYLGWIHRSFRFGVGQPKVLMNHWRRLVSPKGLLVLFPVLTTLYVAFTLDFQILWKLLAWHSSLLLGSILIHRIRHGKTTVRSIDLLLFASLSHYAYLSGIAWGFLPAISEKIRDRFREKPDFASDEVAQVT